MRIKKQNDVEIKKGSVKVPPIFEGNKVEGDKDLTLLELIERNPVQLDSLVKNPIWQYLIKHFNSTEQSLINALILNNSQDKSMYIRGSIDTVREYIGVFNSLMKINSKKSV
jgi:hypothetical protein